jgi:protein phosphatase
MNWWQEPTTSGSPFLSVGAASEPGPVREENEDAYGHFTGEETDGEPLFIVADGMGGHKHGREASTTTVQVVEETYFGDRDGTALDRLRVAFRKANEQVHAKGNPQSDRVCMGTTATALALVDGQAYLAHIGDSRAYRFRPDGGEQLTRDHTVPQKMRRDGILTAEEARTHPRRGTLTRAIGAESTVEVDLIEVGALRPKDHFLLSTDGLEDLPVDALREVVLNNAPQAACEQLVHRANERGGQDNATTLIVRIEPS